MKHSIIDIPAIYAVSQEVVSSSPMLTMWAGWCDNVLIGYYATRTDAECCARWAYSQSLVAEDMMEVACN